VSDFQKHIQERANYVYTSVLLIFVWRFVSNALLSQIGADPIIFPDREIIHRLFIGTGTPQFITSHYVFAALFDITLFILPIAFLVTLNKWWAVLFSVVASVYFLTFNVITGHHYHGLVGVLVISVPFWFTDKTRFNFAWEAARYYLLYIFVSAALWKIMRGSLFYPLQLSNILKAQQLDLLLQNPDSIRAAIASYLISNPTISHYILYVNVLVQASFTIGFFTKKFDTLLLVVMLAFCVANYFVMGISSFELLILSILLLKKFRPNPQDTTQPANG
jgi:hypothetical protein